MSDLEQFIQVSVINHMHMVKGTYLSRTSACYLYRFRLVFIISNARQIQGDVAVLYIHV